MTVGEPRSVVHRRAASRWYCVSPLGGASGVGPMTKGVRSEKVCVRVVQIKEKVSEKFVVIDTQLEILR